MPSTVTFSPLVKKRARAILDRCVAQPFGPEDARLENQQLLMAGYAVRIETGPHPVLAICVLHQRRAEPSTVILSEAQKGAGGLTWEITMSSPDIMDPEWLAEVAHLFLTEDEMQQVDFDIEDSADCAIVYVRAPYVPQPYEIAAYQDLVRARPDIKPILSVGD